MGVCVSQVCCCPAWALDGLGGSGGRSALSCACANCWVWLYFTPHAEVSYCDVFEALIWEAGGYPPEGGGGRGGGGGSEWPGPLPYP